MWEMMKIVSHLVLSSLYKYCNRMPDNESEYVGETVLWVKQYCSPHVVRVARAAPPGASRPRGRWIYLVLRS